MNFLLNVMGNHRSVRNFSNKDISTDLMNQIFEVCQWASTSNHLQAYSVIVIREENKKKSLSELSGHQAHIAECPVFLVFCADLNRIKLSHEIEKKSMNLKLVEPLLVATVDTALFGQNVLLAAESLGLGGVFIGGIRNNPQEVCNLLNIPEHVFPLFGMCLGYPEKLNEQKPRMPLSAVVHTEQYENAKLAGLIQEYNSTMKHYYENRTSAQRSQTWTDYVSELYKEPRRAHMADFLKEKKFGFN